jgi:hypothetical protein
MVCILFKKKKHSLQVLITIRSVELLLFLFNFLKYFDTVILKITFKKIYYFNTFKIKKHYLLLSQISSKIQIKY